MDTNKIREQFEATYAAESTKRNGCFHQAVLTRDDGGDYVIPSVQSAWWAWQASRESVAIDLPEGKSLAERMYGPRMKGSDQLINREDAVEAIEIHGLKVLP